MQFTFFFFNDTATTEIYTLSLHDALPISRRPGRDLPLHLPRARAIPVPQGVGRRARRGPRAGGVRAGGRAQARERAWLAVRGRGERSEEHTSELQSRLHLVCRLLLEKKKE